MKHALLQFVEPEGCIVRFFEFFQQLLFEGLQVLCFLFLTFNRFYMKVVFKYA